MARRAVRTAITVGKAVPLVVGALALDPTAALAASCDTSGTSLACNDELGSVAVATSDDQVRLSAQTETAGVNAAISPRGALVECYVCTIDPGPVKGHPACISGFDPVVDPWIEEAVAEILDTSR